MQIKKITINNFKGHDFFVLDNVKKLNIILGAMGSGKTSILEAIRFCLTGDIAKTAIRNGANYASVILELEHDILYREIKYNNAGTLTQKIKLNNKTITAVKLAEWLEETYGLNKQMLKCSLSSEVIKSMDSGEFGNFLMQFVPEELSLSKIIGYMKTYSKPLYPVLTEFFPETEQFGIDTVKDGYQFFFETRKDLKKEVEAAKIKATWSGNIPTRSGKQIEDELSALLKEEGKREEILKQQKAYETAQKRKEEQKKRVQALTEQLKSMPVGNNVSEQDLLEFDKKISDIQNKIRDAEKISTSLSDSLRLTSDILTKLNSSVCPIHKDIVCQTDKSSVKNDLEENKKKTEDALSVQTSLIKTLQKELKSCQDAKTTAIQQQSAYYKRQQVLTKIKEIQANKIILPEKPDLSFSDNSEKIRVLQEEKNVLQKYSQCCEEKAKYDRLQARLVLVDTIVNALSPKGDVMYGINNYYISTFENLCESRSQALGLDLKIRFKSEQGIKIYYQKKDVLTEISGASQGEQGILLFLVLDMINQLTGLNILLIDDVNHLDKNAFSALLSLLSSPEVQDYYYHIFLCGINFKEIAEQVKTIHNTILL